MGVKGADNQRRDNENNGQNCKKQQKKNKQRQNGARGTEAIVKGREFMILLCI